MILFFDIETTGLSQHNNEIIEVCGIIYDEVTGELEATFDHLIKPVRPIPRMITELTGITNQMVTSAYGEGVVLGMFKDFVSKYDLIAIAGHNIKRFDLPFIKTRMQKAGLETDFLSYTDIIDTLDLAKECGKRKVLPNYNFTTEKGNVSYKLDNLIHYFDLGEQDHRAINDVQFNIEVYKSLTNLLEEEDVGF